MIGPLRASVFKRVPRHSSAHHRTRRTPWVVGRRHRSRKTKPSLSNSPQLALLDANWSELHCGESRVIKPMSTPSSFDPSPLPSLPPLRCLFLDNYDSYSYNLVDLIGVLSGCQPIIRWNTTPFEEILKLIETSSIDCIVISPGPGNPENLQDFGVCCQVLKVCTNIPILGICLGLQGACSTLGTRIIPAYEPRHGRLSKLSHDGFGLFTNIPQQVEVVRYNSLIVDLETLHPSLQVTAWSEWDGTSTPFQTYEEELHMTRPREVMGLRTRLDYEGRDVPHVTAPRESVQFHPESICTNFGRRMVWNFFQIVTEWKREKERVGDSKIVWNVRDILPNTTTEDRDNKERTQEEKEKKIKKKNDYVLLWQKLPVYVDSATAFLSLYANSDDTSRVSSVPAGVSGSTVVSSTVVANPSTTSTFWLDSSKVEYGRSRFSFMGSSSGPLSYTISYSIRSPKELRIDGVTEMIPDGVVDGNHNVPQVWKRLEEMLEQHSADRKELGKDGTIVPNDDDDDNGNDELPFPFEGGFVGHIGYAMKALSTPDSLPPIHLPFNNNETTSDQTAQEEDEDVSDKFRPPDLGLIFADRMLVWDHQEETIYATCLCKKEQTSTTSSSSVAGGFVQDGIEWIKMMTQQLEGIVIVPHANGNNNSHPTSTSVSSPTPSSSSSSSPLSSVSDLRISSCWFHNKTEYLDAIRQCLDAIRQGESYEVCLTNQLNVRVDREQHPMNQNDSSPSSSSSSSSVRPLDYYLTLRRVNPAAYAAYFSLAYEHFGDTAPPTTSSTVAPSTPSTLHWHICCSSPERFLQVTHSRLVESKPIKGTSPRDLEDPLKDEASRKALQESRKDFAENLMIVDLLRNDLSHVCQYGTIAVPKLMEVETYATIHNLVSTIQGRLCQDKTTFDLIQATFPPGSMTGAPKLRTCQILSKLEQEPKYQMSQEEEEVDNKEVNRSSSTPSRRSRERERGIYSGNIGWIGLNGGMADLNVVIRTAIVREVRHEASQRCSTHFTIGAGGAIVYLSNPEEEYAEIHLKTKALVHAIQLATEERRTQG